MLSALLPCLNGDGVGLEVAGRSRERVGLALLSTTSSATDEAGTSVPSPQRVGGALLIPSGLVHRSSDSSHRDQQSDRCCTTWDAFLLVKGKQEDHARAWCDAVPDTGASHSLRPYRVGACCDGGWFASCPSFDNSEKAGSALAALRHIKEAPGLSAPPTR